MKIRLLIPVFSALLIAPAAIAQLDMHQPVQVTIPTKFGVVNMRLAIMATADWNQSIAQLKTQFAPRNAELQELQTKIEQEQTQLSNGQATLSDQTRADMRDELARLQRSYQRNAQETEDDANDAQQEVVDRIGQRIVKLLAEYSTQNGYAMVLDNSAQQSPVLYAATQIDLTEKRTKLYDQHYPLNTSATKAIAPK